MRKAVSYRMAVFAAAALIAASSAALAASTFAGTWKVTDTSGKPFEIILKDDGTAAADRAGEGMKGTWKEEAGGVVIAWDTGWTTKISKDGDKFKKTAFEKGKAVDGPGASSSAAEKVK
jgi:hypothetical protein